LWRTKRGRSSIDLEDWALRGTHEGRKKGKVREDAPANQGMLKRKGGQLK